MGSTSPGLSRNSVTAQSPIWTELHRIISESSSLYKNTKYKTPILITDPTLLGIIFSFRRTSD